MALLESRNHPLVKYSDPNTPTMKNLRKKSANKATSKVYIKPVNEKKSLAQFVFGEDLQAEGIANVKYLDRPDPTRVTLSSDLTRLVLKGPTRSKFTDCSRQRRRLSLTLPDPQFDQNDTQASNEENVHDKKYNNVSATNTKKQESQLKKDIQDHFDTLTHSSNSKKPLSLRQRRTLLSRSVQDRDISTQRKEEFIRKKSAILNSQTPLGSGTYQKTYHKRDSSTGSDTDSDESIDPISRGQKLQGTCMIPLITRTRKLDLCEDRDTNQSKIKKQDDRHVIRRRVKSISENTTDEESSVKHGLSSKQRRCSEFDWGFDKESMKRNVIDNDDDSSDNKSAYTESSYSTGISLTKESEKSKEDILQRFNEALKSLDQISDHDVDIQHNIRLDNTKDHQNHCLKTMKNKKVSRINRLKPSSHQQTMIRHPSKQIMFPPYDYELRNGLTTASSNDDWVMRTRSPSVNSWKEKVKVTPSGRLMEELVAEAEDGVDWAMEDLIERQNKRKQSCSKPKPKSQKCLIIRSIKINIATHFDPEQLGRRAESELPSWGYDVLSRLQRGEGRGGVHVATMLADNRNSRRRSPVELTAYRKSYTKFLSSIMTIEGPSGREYYSQKHVRATPPHPNLIMLLHRFETKLTTYQVTEHCAWPTLAQLVHIAHTESPLYKGGLSEDKCRTIFKQICEGLHHLHSNDVLHGDLSCHNVLVTDSLRVKLTGYGPCCQRIMPTLQSIRHSKSVHPGHHDAYTPPEVINKRSPWRRSSDVWCLGVTLLNMLLGHIPSEVTHSVKMSFATHAVSRCNLARMPYQVTLLIDTMLQTQPSFRPTTSRVLKHGWLNQEFPLVPSGKEVDRYDMCSQWLNYKCINYDKVYKVDKVDKIDSDKSFPRSKAQQARDAKSLQAAMFKGSNTESSLSAASHSSSSLGSIPHLAYPSVPLSPYGSVPPSPKRPVTTPRSDSDDMAQEFDYDHCEFGYSGTRSPTIQTPDIKVNGSMNYVNDTHFKTDDNEKCSVWGVSGEGSQYPKQDFDKTLTDDGSESSFYDIEIASSASFISDNNTTDRIMQDCLLGNDSDTIIDSSGVRAVMSGLQLETPVEEHSPLSIDEDASSDDNDVNCEDGNISENNTDTKKNTHVGNSSDAPATFKDISAMRVSDTASDYLAKEATWVFDCGTTGSNDIYINEYRCKVEGNKNVNQSRNGYEVTVCGSDTIQGLTSCRSTTRLTSKPPPCPQSRRKHFAMDKNMNNFSLGMREKRLQSK